MANHKKTGWKKYWQPARSQYVTHKEKGSNGNHSFNMNNFKSWLPEYYEGPTNRLIRYSQYDQMDMDHEVNAALDTIAEFSTLESGITGLPFEVETTNTDMSSKEVEIVQNMLRQWCNLNEFNKRIFRIFRNSIKYGDQFFIRDPETYKLMWVDPATVEKVQVNEAKGKEIEIYFIKDLDLNLQSMVATNVHSKHGTGNDLHSGSVISQSASSSQSPKTRPNTFLGLGGGSGQTEAESTEVDATHVVHMSLTEGMDAAWPFGVSILERIYKIFKQKELLEDSILIYRIHRAPQRLAFNIHVGDMPPHRAQEYLEQVKNQINQKRIPSRDGEGMGGVDAAYNPMCISLSTKIPLLDGRELTLNELISEYEDGKENWTYSCDPVTGKVVPGPISWAGITKRDAKVIRLTFDNGESLVCTPDHKIPVLGKGFVEAGELTNKDELINFNTFNEESHNYIISIDRPDRVENVGTLTIDQEEKYHDYHTFAISAGIFIKNSILENYYFTRNAEGTGSSVESIGGDMDGVKNIDDMKYFNNKMLRALAVPSSYLPTGPDDGSQPYSDGRISAAFIQEFRFDRYCKRLQRSIVDTLDREFKLYLKYRGIEFDAGDFDLKFSEPQNFSEYRQLEIDQMRINLFTSVQNVPFISNQYALKRYLGWTDVDMQENEELWKKENNFDQIMEEHEQLVSDRDIKQMDMDDEEIEEDEGETDMPAFDDDEVEFDDEDIEEAGEEGEEPEM